jgi:Tol biopolymer transport system component
MSSLSGRLPAGFTPFARTLGAVTVALGLLAGATAPLEAQYFGRNKVPYERFDFDVLRTAHFDVHFYDAEKVAARDAARMLERWNSRFSSLLQHQLSARKPVVLYADQPDFQQTNVISDQLDEGTGGVTESFLDRMVLPLTGSYAESDHVLGHEAVHVFQYDIASKQHGGGRFEQLPLWIVEGMAEYLSVGPNDRHTAMWLRDALQRNDLPSIRALTNSARYFPYRYGEALWAYIGGTWGDAMVAKLFRASLQRGFDEGVRRELGMNVDALSKRWHESIERTYRPLLAGRTRPAETGHRIGVAARSGEHNVSPSLSPDGRQVAYFSTRGLLGVELLLADATTGEVTASLATPGLRTRFDALSFIYSAGSWSPDGARFAFVTYADGDNEIIIVDVASRRIERRIRPRGIGAISSVAWSPEGGRIALSGSDGGMSDLFVIDLASGDVRRLTNDKYADLQPTWSPDGSSLAFVSDRAIADDESPAAEGSDFQRLRYAPLRLALIEVATARVRVVSTFADAKHLSPQFSSDGRSLLFVADPRGYSDVYRVELESGRLFQITHAATGVSGIAATSPAMSVSRNGRAVFSVFERGGTQLASLSAEETRGDPLGSDASSPEAGRMPRDSVSGTSVVAGYLHDADSGLPADSSVTERPYRAGFQLAAIGQPMLGVGVGGAFGTQVVGGASAFFTDVLGDHSLGVALQASGTMRDIGGQLLYIDASRRWTWGAAVERIPYVLGYTAISDTTISLRNGGATRGTAVDYVLAHIAVSGGSLLTQFARSTTQRVELQAGYSRYDYGLEVSRDVYVGNSRIANQRTELPAPSSLGMVNASAALVGDDAALGFTSPISGTRYRFEITPTIGSLGYQTLLADFRRYFFIRPLTLAFRGVHYGRYGRDADSDRLGSLFVGDGSLVRGYSYQSFNASECSAATTSGSLAGSNCPEFERLVGSRIAVANLELRIPLVGQHGHGLMQTGALPPLELAPFFDVGSAWTASSKPVFSLTRSSSERTAVASAGLALRVNLFGFAVLQSYYALPFQRPTRSGVWGFVLQPGF